MRGVRYERYGAPDVLEVVELAEPIAGPGDVVVELRAAGLNPADYKVRRGATPVRDLPSGIGREFAGVVIAVGTEVGDVEVGAEVLGTGEWVLAERVSVPAAMVAPKPRELDWAIAASIPVVAQTAWAAVQSQHPARGDTALVSNAAGGVGFLVCQLLVRQGVRVIGSAGIRNHARLAAIGVEPTEYGAGLVERVAALAPRGLTVAFDHHGPESIEAALQLGVPRARINTISGYADWFAVAHVGRSGLDRAVVDALAAELAAGTLSMPVDSTFPLDRVVEAYTHLESGGPTGKVVITFP